MSILQDYERFKASISKQEWEYITTFLDSYNEYMLSDLLYSQAVYKEYEEWKTKQ